jgi:hypothetical protein
MAYTSINKPDDYFRIAIYNGNNNPQNIGWNTNTSNEAPDYTNDMQPNIVWIKSRAGNTVFGHVWGDSVRGGGIYQRIDDPGAEVSNNNVIKTFNSNGFSVGGATFVSEGSRTYVGWGWKETADAGLDIVSYTGNGSNPRNISHNLSAIPHWILIMDRDQGVDRFNYHQAIGNTHTLLLNATNPKIDSDVWNDTTPTSSVFTLGTNDVNANNVKYMAYVWTEKKGFSKFGSYKGNGNIDGPMIYTGFRPAWIMIRNTGATENWVLFDSKRDVFNEMSAILRADSAAAEGNQPDSYAIDFLSNGFKIREDDGKINSSNVEYVFMCFAESPFVNSNGLPVNAR